MFYFTLKPLYLWESGSLQIADIALLIGVVYLFFVNRGRFGLEKRSASATKLFLVLIVYQFSINLIWYASIQHQSLLKSSVYYLFNFIAFFVTLIICEMVNIDAV